MGRPERIEEVIDGTQRPADPAAPLLLSIERPWCGFLLEMDEGRDGCAGSIVHRHTSLVLVDVGSIQVEHAHSARVRRFIAGPGSVTLWPAGYEARAIRWRAEPASTRMIRAQTNLAALARLLPDEDRLVRRPLALQPATEDPLLASMLRAMAQDIALGWVTPHQYVLGQRIERAKALPADRACPVADVALSLGFSSQSHFTQVFRRFVGTTPGSYRQIG